MTMASKEAARRPKFHTVTDPKKSPVLTIVVGMYLFYALVPFVWLVINATKTKADFISTFGLSFGRSFALWNNLVEVFTYNDGIFGRWVLNTVGYTVVGTVVSVLLAAMGGYALSKLEFGGRRAIMLVILGSMAVPGVALVIPQFLMFSAMGITNTPWAVIIPSFLNPFGLYLMWTFFAQSVPDSLLEAARIDGAGEARIFFQIVVPIMKPSIVSVAILEAMWIWNDYLLPYLTLDLGKYKTVSVAVQYLKGGYGSVDMGAMMACLVLAIIPIIVFYLVCQKYIVSGVMAGAVKG